MRRLRQEDCEFRAILSYIEILSQIQGHSTIAVCTDMIRFPQSTLFAIGYSDKKRGWVTHWTQGLSFSFL